MELTGKMGAHAVIDFVNASKTVEAGHSGSQRRAKLVWWGSSVGELKLSLVSMPTRAYRLIGSYTGTLSDMVELVSLARRGVIKPLVSNRFKLDQATEALTMLKEGRIIGRRSYKSLNEQGKVKTVNPATEEVLNEYQIMTKQQINDKAKKARNAFDEWKNDKDKRV